MKVNLPPLFEAVFEVTPSIIFDLVGGALRMRPSKVMLHFLGMRAHVTAFTFVDILINLEASELS